MSKKMTFLICLVLDIIIGLSWVIGGISGFLNHNFIQGIVFIILGILWISISAGLYISKRNEVIVYENL